MSYQADLLAFESVLSAGWAATPIRLPNHEFKTPKRQGQYPTAAYIALGLDYSDGTELVSLGGTVQKEGVLRHGIWVQGNVGESVVFTMADDLQSFWNSNPVAGYQLFPFGIAGRTVVLSEAEETEDGWWGRELGIPFNRFVEA